MKKSRLTEEQIAYALRLAEAARGSGCVRQIGISEAISESTSAGKICRPTRHLASRAERLDALLLGRTLPQAPLFVEP